MPRAIIVFYVLLCCSGLIWSEDKVIYGVDNRQEAFAISDPNVLKLIQADVLVTGT